MKVQSSEYLKANKALYKELLDKLLNTYEYASILAADSVGKVYSVSKSGIDHCCIYLQLYVQTHVPYLAYVQRSRSISSQICISFCFLFDGTCC